MTTAHLRVGFTIGRRVAEVTPSFDDLLWRTSADSQLEPPIADQIGRPRRLDHVERVFISHVDDARSDLDAARSGTDCCQKREGRRELSSKVVNAKVCTIRAELLRRHGELDGLLEDIARGPRGGVARFVPMTT